MRTQFTAAQLADSDIAVADKILRKCVHCGFCTATCPTYVLLGDELDSPRGRIALIKDLLEQDRPPTAEVVKHIDRCLSCLACATTCPSGVDYMHLIDQARVRIERDYRRPLLERLMRTALIRILPSPRRMQWALRLAALVKPLIRFWPEPGARRVTPTFLDRLRAVFDLAPQYLPGRKLPLTALPDGIFSPQGQRRGRVALLQGCAQQILAPEINAAAVRVLNRQNVDVVLVGDEICCGALSHHLGDDGDALAKARHNVDAWIAEADRAGLDAIVTTTSGCGTVIKDYGFLLRDDAVYAAKAARVSSLTQDISEYLLSLEPSFAPASNRDAKGLVIAYHAACSLQHAQKIVGPPKELLSKFGFVVKDVPEAHLCCGSAGTYNLMQPNIAKQLRDRKVANIVPLAPDMIAAGNIGCIVQIEKGVSAAGGSMPVLHTIELLDWITGGPRPRKFPADGRPG
jgi:glycolate oxidase iron-sulfur subunit